MTTGSRESCALARLTPFQPFAGEPRDVLSRPAVTAVPNGKIPLGTEVAVSLKKCFYGKKIKKKEKSHVTNDALRSPLL